MRLHRHVELELLVDLVAPHLGEVVAFGVEEKPLDEVLRVIYVHRLARTLTPEDFQQRVVARGRIVPLQRVPYEPRVLEAVQDLLRPPEAQRLQKYRNRQLPLPVDPDRDIPLSLDLELQPGAAARHQARRQDLLGLVLRLHDVRARRTHELRHHDPLGTVDDEGPRLGHEREIAHEDVLLPELPRLLDNKANPHEKRRGVRLVFRNALFDGSRRLLEVRLTKLDGIGTRKIFYG